MAPEGIFTQAQIEYLNTHFVAQQACYDRHTQQEKEMTEIKVQLMKMNTLLNLLLKVSAFIGTGIGALLIGAIGKLVIK